MTHHHKFKLLLAILASIVLAVGLTSAPANAASKGGKIKGVVTLDGKPLKGAKVKLMRTDTDSGDAYSVYKTATTSSKGYYSFSGSPLKGWTYNRVIVSDPQHRAVTTVRSLNGRSTKTVTRNVTMKGAGSITGKVTLADGSSPTAAQASRRTPRSTSARPATKELAYLDERQANAKGTYRFVGLPAGTYTLSYADSAKKYLNECYDDTVIHQSADFYCEKATKITVKAGSNTPLVEQQLNHESAHLRGTVTNTSGQPLKNIFVTPYRVGVSTPTWYQTGSTRSNGRFAIEPIDAGNWQAPGARQRRCVGVALVQLSQPVRCPGLLARRRHIDHQPGHQAQVEGNIDCKDSPWHPSGHLHHQGGAQSHRRPSQRQSDCRARRCQSNRLGHKGCREGHADRVAGWQAEVPGRVQGNLQHRRCTQDGLSHDSLS
ncbi:collagen binding domain-containing protein [Aeromicrobium sp. UC242_57]|uniref:collagen binding domain-containing protein n=1 Tax=Aeromicrobium sp. UC242_57 TaxID=3374624 RepID=UPI0037A35016